MRSITPVDRFSVAALAVADAGIGLFLVGAGTLPQIDTFHAVVGVLALALAVPALVTVVIGRLPPAADEGVLVNVGLLAFMTVQVLLLPAQPTQRLGLAILLLAATMAAAGLYLRLFGVLHLIAGRRASGQ